MISLNSFADMSETNLQNTESNEGFCVQMQLGVIRDWVTVDVDLSNAQSSEVLKNNKYIALKEAAVNLITKTVGFLELIFSYFKQSFTCR